MNNISSISTYVLNIALCLFLAFYIKHKLDTNKISRIKAKWSYALLTLVISFVVSYFGLVGIAALFNSMGIPQEFGHTGGVITILISFVLGVIMIPCGLTIITWEPMKW